MTSNQLWRVVVVDDSPDDRAEVRRLLLKGSNRRYAFIEAESGTAGVRAIRTAAQLPDCVVLDFHLPDMDALEVLAELVGADGMPVCPVVVLTGGDSVDMGRAVLRAGAQDFIGKSWLSPPGLTRALDNARERWAMARELREQKATLRDNEQRQRLVLEASRIGTFEVESGSSQARWNAVQYELLGLRPGEVPSTTDTFFRFVHPEDVAQLQSNWEADEHSDPKESEFRIVRADGEVRWLVGRWMFFSESGDSSAQPGRRSRYLGVNFDITDLKRAEAKLRQQAAELSDADRRKDEFLATLAHELLNPLAPIRSGVTLLRMSRKPEQTEQTLDMIDRQLQHFVSLVNDLLDISRVRSGKIILRSERVEAGSFVAAAVEACRPLITGKDHTLEVQLPTDPLAVTGDPTRLFQIVVNLLTNAAKYSEPNSHIRISVVQDGDALVLRVADTGMGIAADDLPSLWGIFSQVRGTLNKAQGGLGIGLSLVKNLVQLHGGTVAAESPGLGHGSTFSVRLPLLAASQALTSRALLPTAAPANLEARTDAPGSRRILVVDDNVDGAVSLCMLLNLFGHITQIAHTGADALSAAYEFAPDLVLLDIGLPGLDGYEVAKRLRSNQATAAATLVALTGRGTEDDRQRSQDAGFDFHFTKPIEWTAVQELLTQGRPGATRHI